MWTKFWSWLKSFFSKLSALVGALPISQRGRIDRKNFFSSVRNDFGKLKQSQVDGFNAILNEWSQSGWDDIRWLAYMLATAWHETAKTMQAIEEYGKGKGHPYGEIDPQTGFAYFGRGLVQLTWVDNYKRIGQLLGISLYENPELALDMPVAVQVMFKGMEFGVFTRKKLSDYFNSKTDDPVGARKIINGTDRAELIAGYHAKFLKALGAV